MDLPALRTDPSTHSRCGPLLAPPFACGQIRTVAVGRGTGRGASKTMEITRNEFLTLTGSIPILRESIGRFAKRGPLISCLPRDFLSRHSSLP